MHVKNKTVAALKALATAMALATATPPALVVSVTPAHETGSGQRHGLRLSVSVPDSYSPLEGSREVEKR